jgi:hypothetical protein
MPQIGAPEQKSAMGREAAQTPDITMLEVLG